MGIPTGGRAAHGETVRVIEAVELVACHVFNTADRDDQSVSMQLVRQRLARLAEQAQARSRLLLPSASSTS